MLLRLATSDKSSQIDDMMQPYYEELSNYVEINIGDDGRYHNRWLPSYWVDNYRVPYLITEDDVIKGFALVLINDPEVEGSNMHSISEFYIKPEYRSKGLGARAASEIINSMPGKWIIRELINNKPAIAFWRKVIKNIVCEDFSEITNSERVIQRFNIKNREATNDR